MQTTKSEAVEVSIRFSHMDTPLIATNPPWRPWYRVVWDGLCIPYRMADSLVNSLFTDNGPIRSIEVRFKR